MEHPPSNTIVIAPEPPPFPAPPRSVDLSPLEFILALIAIVTIPALIYTFFFSIKCPPVSFRSSTRRRSSSSNFSETLSVAGSSELNSTSTSDLKDEVSDVKYQKERHGKDIGSECPVCLCAFSDEEEVKQLSGCKHSFHAACIDMWLHSHSNCPVCRAPTTTNNVSRVISSASRIRNNHVDDLQQGLPDAASLV